MSSDIERHLYVITWPNFALVASMLPPHEFGKHYTIGSSRYFHGHVIFGEIDVNYRNDYFQIDKYLADVKPNDAGEPKRTKFIATYRVLEHIDFSAFLNLYVTSVEGKVFTLEKQRYERAHETGFIRTFQEICPLRTIVLTSMTPQEFGRYITDPDQPKGAPKVMFTQIEFDIDAFLQHLEADPFHSSPIPNVHPHKLRQQILELRSNPEKRVKGISLDSALGQISFLRLRTGFWFAHGDEILYYPLPDQSTPDKTNYEWYKSLQGE